MLATLLIADGAVAQQTAPEYPEREFALAFCVWGSELEGTVEADGISVDIDASFSDILEELNGGVMAAGGARIGRWVGQFDAMWMELREEVETGTLQLGPVTLGPAEIDPVVTQGMLDVKAGYRLLEPEPSRPIAFDLLAGGRYWYLRSEIDAEFALLPDVSVDESIDWVDALIGARAVVGISPKLQLIAMADIGGWDVGSASHKTWPLMGLLGVSLSERWSLRLGYRALRVERDQADLELRGPIVGALYRF